MGDPEAELDKPSLRAKVDEVLGELRKQIPELSYRILYLHWIEGRTMAEIAALLDLSIERVWARHHRAKRKFRCLFNSIPIDPCRSSGNTAYS
jgi:DNA-directed RNA polymerase specialized sigma24 family protein